MTDEFSQDNFDDIFDDLKVGRSQKPTYQKRLRSLKPFSGRKVFRVSLEPSRRTNNMLIHIFLKGPEFTFDRDQPSPEHARWIEAAKAAYREVPGAFDLPMTVVFFSLAAIEREWGSFDRYYR